MNKQTFSPYIRIAMHSVLAAPFTINERIIFDYEIIFVQEGKCRLTVDGKEYICKKNNVVFIRPDIPHKMECVDNSDFVQPHIHFDVIYSDKSEITPVSFKSRKKMTPDEISLIQDDIFADIDIPVVFIPNDIQKFKTIFFEIIMLYQEKKYNYELLYKAKLLELLCFILSHFEENKSNKDDTDDNSIIAVKNYIDNNYLSVITLDALSTQFHFNKYTLMRKFKAMYGQNVISYYKSKRISYAKDILKTTNLSVYSISEKMNFSVIYSFSRFFKICTDMSPTEYRKKFSNKH